jgi:thiol-disulfide isomerase/thioredoxin
MAEYKSSKKKKGNDDKFLTYLILGFAGVLLTIIGGMIINSFINPTLDYDSFETLTSYQQIDSMPEDQYFVYFYGSNCGHCVEIKEQLLRFANENDAGMKVYFLESYGATGYNTIVDPDSGDPMNGTPTLITVVNGNIVDLSVGKILIIDTIDNVNDGTYGYIN